MSNILDSAAAREYGGGSNNNWNSCTNHICSASHCSQITTTSISTQFFHRADALSAAQSTLQSKCRITITTTTTNNNNKNRKAPGKITRHHALDNLVACAFTSAGIPSSKEPHGLVRSDGKQPDGLTLVPWKGGKPLAWDITAVCTVADSYVAAMAREAGAAVECAAELKISKYSGLVRFGG